MADAIEAVDDAVATKIDTTKPTTEIKADGVEDEVASLHVGNLTRNVKSNHIEEIFGCYGTVTNVDLQIDTRTGVSKGFAYVTFEKSKDAEQAVLYLDGGQLDGNEIKVSFVLVSKRRKDSPDRDGGRGFIARPIGRDPRGSNRQPSPPRRRIPDDRTDDRDRDRGGGRYGTQLPVTARGNAGKYGPGDPIGGGRDRSPPRGGGRGPAWSGGDRDRDWRRGPSPVRRGRVGRSPSPVRRRDDRNRSPPRARAVGGREDSRDRGRPRGAPGGATRGRSLSRSRSRSFRRTRSPSNDSDRGRRRRRSSSDSSRSRSPSDSRSDSDSRSRSRSNSKSSKRSSSQSRSRSRSRS